MSISSWLHWNFAIRSSIIMVCTIIGENSLLLEDLDDFLAEFNYMFGETDRVQTATTKLCSLRQGSHPVLVYTANFRQLACDVD
jgi:hypothetical protein